MATKVKGTSTPKMSPEYGPRTGHQTLRLSPTTVERARTDPNDLVCRNTNFRQNFTDPVKIPNVIKGTSASPGGRKRISVGQIRET